MVYVDEIYSETLFCDAWWQTTQVPQVHQVQPTAKEVTLQKPQHVLLWLPLPVLVLSYIYFKQKNQTTLLFTL